VSKLDTSQVIGRLVGLIRISKGFEVESQKGVIEGFANSLSNSIVKWYADLDRTRWQYGQSEAIRRLKADADAGLLDWVIVDKAQRIGTFNERELFHFLHELERRGARIWSVAEGDLLDPNVMRSLEMVLGSQSEQKDQRNKAQNVARGMRLNAMEFRFNGAVMPYGYDRICVGPDGKERFRLVEDIREENPGYVPGSKEQGEQRWLNWYVVIYPGGHEERRIGPPGKGEHEWYEFAPSVRLDRRKWAAQVFRWYAEGLNRTRIATLLNESGADLGHRSYWATDHVTYMLANPIYGGRHQWRRRTFAVYSSIGPDGMYEDVERRMPGQKRHRKVEDEGVIRSPKVREDLRLVDEETLAKVAHRLAHELAGTPSEARGRSDSFWLQPLLRCGHCNGSMRAHGMTRPARKRNGKSRAVTHCFLCSGFARGYFGPRTCVHNRIRLDELERLTHEFLDKYGHEIELAREDEAGPNMDRLQISRDRYLSLYDDYKAEMHAYLDGRLSRQELARLRDGTLNLVEVYRHHFDQEQGQRAAEIARIEDEIGDLAFKAIAYQEGSVARRKLDEGIARKEEEVKALKAAQVPVDERLDAVGRQLDEINAAIRKIRDHASARRMKQAAELLRGVVREIRVFSVENPLKGGSRPDRITDRVVFVPHLGDPMEFRAAPSTGSVPLGSLERARQLWGEGHNLNRIASMLTAEGLPTARGTGAWSRATLLKALASEIAGAGGRRDGRLRGHRPKGQDRRDAGR
jgi:hypothetical protein